MQYWRTANVKDALKSGEINDIVKIKLFYNWYIFLTKSEFDDYKKLKKCDFKEGRLSGGRLAQLKMDDTQVTEKVLEHLGALIS